MGNTKWSRVTGIAILEYVESHVAQQSGTRKYLQIWRPRATSVAAPSRKMSAEDHTLALPLHERTTMLCASKSGTKPQPLSAQEVETYLAQLDGGWALATFPDGKGGEFQGLRRQFTAKNFLQVRPLFLLISSVASSPSLPLFFCCRHRCRRWW